ncbi:MAG TPA: YraN family protein [Patescibacteria group bacterium]|nr:YraN family protein [Patescibacteria group bacterium]
MTRRRTTLGLQGEEIAARHFESRGFRILARRYRTRLGEIDLVARSDDLLVFIEVKTRTGAGFGSPQESVHPLKQARLCRVASLFLAEHPAFVRQEITCRFDVVAILCEQGRPPRLAHIVDAFRPVG